MFAPHLNWFDPSSGQLGQPPSLPVITLRQGHRYSARWSAPVNCALIPPQVVTATLQTLGAQTGLQNPWDQISYMSTASGLGCSITTDATWTARDAAIDPEIIRLPSLAAFAIEEIRDVNTGEVIYDVTRIEGSQTPPPGPPPIPPARPAPPPPAPPPGPQPPDSGAPKPSTRRGGAGAGTAIAIGLLLLGGLAALTRRGR